MKAQGAQVEQNKGTGPEKSYFMVNLSHGANMCCFFLSDTRRQTAQAAVLCVDFSLGYSAAGGSVPPIQ